MFRTHDAETANLFINATQNEGQEFTPAYAANVLIGKPPLAPPELWLDPIHGYATYLHGWPPTRTFNHALNHAAFWLELEPSVQPISEDPTSRRHRP